MCGFFLRCLLMWYAYCFISFKEDMHFSRTPFKPLPLWDSFRTFSLGSSCESLGGGGGLTQQGPRMDLSTPTLDPVSFPPRAPFGNGELRENASQVSCLNTLECNDGPCSRSVNAHSCAVAASHTSSSDLAKYFRNLAARDPHQFP